MQKLVIWRKKWIFGFDVREDKPELDVEVKTLHSDGKTVTYTTTDGMSGQRRIDHFNYDFLLVTESAMTKSEIKL